MIKEHDTYDYNTVFTQKDAEVYAKLTDDYNPIHIDREYATATEFGRPVAFGTMWPADKLAYFISQNVTYLRPVYIDEPYHIRFECTNVDHKRMIGTLVGTMRDKDGNSVVITEARIFSKEHFSAPAI